MHDNKQDVKRGIRVTIVGIIANIVLVIIKIYAGFVGRSQALIADGIHSTSDLLSDFIVLFGIKWGRMDADENHPFGHGRIETLSALIVGVLLILAGVGIVYNSVISLYEHDQSQPTIFAMLVAVSSILIKESMYWYTLAAGKRLKSMVIIANAWHHRSDALSSVAVLIGIAGAYFNPDWHLADSLASLFVTYFILQVGWKMVWQALKEVVDTAPDENVLKKMNEVAGSIDGVINAHDIKARFSGGQIISEVHIVVDADISVYDGHAIAKKVEFALIDRIEDVSKVIVHVDPSR